MVRPRLLTATLLLLGLILPAWSDTVLPLTAHADAQIVWHLDSGTFNPTDGQAVTAQTFTPRSAVYLVEVELAGSNSGDEAYVQLGDNQDDITQVRSGEDRFFTASNLKPGTTPAFRIIADPKHNYGGRTLTYSAAVYTVPPTGTEISGVATSAVPNVIVFSAPQATTYTVHYSLDSGSAKLIIIDITGATVKDLGTISGTGATTAILPVGTFALGLEQQPKGSSINWTLSIGLAPDVGAISPANRAQLKQSPATLWAATQANATLVLDNRTVTAGYDAASGHLTYHPNPALAAGLHALAVAGPDGTQAASVSHFLILPPTSIAAPATPAGSLGGLALAHTTTPDGRYRLLKPTTWRMAGSGGTVYLVDPRGQAVIMLSERYLGQTVDASAIVHTIGAKVTSKYSLSGGWSYGGSAAAATLCGTLKSSGQAGAFTLAVRVLPSLDRHGLLIAYGFSLNAAGAPTASTLAALEASLAPNDAAGIVAARPMLHYAADVVTLEYPQGWLANFTDPHGSWFIGQNDQAVLIAAGVATGGAALDRPALKSLGQQVQGYIGTQIHSRLQILKEQTTAGSYRWLAAFSGPDGKLNGVEVGEIVAHNGKVVELFGDTTLDEAPTNLPLFAHVLDSAAQAAGVTQAADYTIDDAAAAMQAITPAATSNGSAAATSAAGGSVTPTQSGSGGYLSAYQSALSSHAAYQSVLDSSYSMYAAEMNVGSNFGDSGISYSYTSNSY